MSDRKMVGYLGLTDRQWRDGAKLLQGVTLAGEYEEYGRRFSSYVLQELEDKHPLHYFHTDAQKGAHEREQVGLNIGYEDAMNLLAVLRFGSDHILITPGRRICPCGCEMYAQIGENGLPKDFLSGHDMKLKAKLNARLRVLEEEMAERAEEMDQIRSELAKGVMV